jgi:hypothetical protein
MAKKDREHGLEPELAETLAYLRKVAADDLERVRRMTGADQRDARLAVKRARGPERLVKIEWPEPNNERTT